ncbi:hypothetical protein [Ornithinimicrobium kibberense]|uniref:hypothetical protein n=1 Tax=Ornithinimicrobium kibberense TaxID=282060 RepID=UPI0036116E57
MQGNRVDGVVRVHVIISLRATLDAGPVCHGRSSPMSSNQSSGYCSTNSVMSLTQRSSSTTTTSTPCSASQS